MTPSQHMPDAPPPELPVLDVRGVGKSFTMHLRGGIELPVMANADFTASAGECVVLGGPSGAGKSSLLKMIYANYRTDRGRILVRHDGRATDVATASPREIIALRRTVIGYVSQFLNVIPRVSARDLVSAAGVAAGLSADAARRRSGDLLARLNIPERLWSLPPATFSGGEQQRVNLACGFVGGHALLLLDEPTASLDAANRAVVVDMILEKKQAGVAQVGIFHDPETRAKVADRIVDVTAFRPASAA